MMLVLQCWRTLSNSNVTFENSALYLYVFSSIYRHLHAFDYRHLHAFVYRHLQLELGKGISIYVTLKLDADTFRKKLILRSVNGTYYFLEKSLKMADVISERGKKKLVYNRYIFWRDGQSSDEKITLWRCSNRYKSFCKARVHTVDGLVTKELHEHSHLQEERHVQIAKALTVVKPVMLRYCKKNRTFVRKNFYAP